MRKMRSKLWVSEDGSEECKVYRWRGLDGEGLCRCSGIPCGTVYTLCEQAVEEVDAREV